MDRTSFDRLVLELRNVQLRGSAVVRLLEELDDIPARELVLDLHQVSDDLIHGSLRWRDSSVKKSVKIAGLCANQIEKMTAFGIELDAIVVGHWPRRLPDVGTAWRAAVRGK